MMKCLLAIIFGIAIYGNPVASQNCYTCSYLSGVAGVTAAIPDYCTDANFNPDSNFVLELPCSGQCAIIDIENPDGSGGRVFSRSCGDGPCDQQGVPGVTCCDGNLCNGPSGGGGGGGGGDGNQCYSCLDVSGYGCDNDNFDQDQAAMVTCQGPCEKRWSMALGLQTSYRGCAIDDEGGAITTCNDNSCDSQSAFGISVETCRFCCDGELCNGAGSVAFSTAMILSATAVSALIVMIF